MSKGVWPYQNPCFAQATRPCFLKALIPDEPKRLFSTSRPFIIGLISPAKVNA